MDLMQIKNEWDAQRLTKAEYIERMNHFYDALYSLQARLPSTWIKSITLSEKEVIFEIKDLHLKMVGMRGDHRIAPHEILTFGSLEPTERLVFEYFVNDAKCFFDIGANMGWYSFLAARKNPQARIFAFEPIPSTYSHLLRNLELNSFPQIHPEPLAFSNQSGVCELYTYPTGSVNASLQNVTGRSDVVKVSCTMKTIDEYVHEKGVQPDLIKVDVEGAELMVFQGAQKTIQAYRPIVFTEILRKWSAAFNYHPNAILALFQQWDYRCFGVHGETLLEIRSVEETTIPTNYFFIPMEKTLKNLTVPVYYSEGSTL